ncbi:MAG TPA: DUF4158 domain-containing protein [Streptosporangiaceae bacterium]|nr:DUF4158 domain-containing protein [Streptosporangiaceae bacterium]
MDRMPLGLDELVEHWTVMDDERDLIGGKRGATRLGFALLLKFYTRHGRFPSGRSELPDEAVEFVAKQVKVPASDLGFYEWSGRTVEYHRNQVREHLGFRECSVSDADKLTDWLAAHVAHAERNPDQVREELARRCRAERAEPPAPARVTRIVRSALHNAEETWFAVIAGRIGGDATARILALIDGEADGEGDGDEDQDSVLALVKSVPGNVSLESMLTEIRKLTAIRAVGLPAGLFAGVAPKVVSGWRARAAVESPSHLRCRLPTSPQSTATLLAALLAEREREVTDSLVDLLIATVHRIGARTERRVTQELISAFRRVSGKENILFAIAEASLARPSEAVREVVYPAVRGGEQTLRELVHEYKTSGPAYRRTVQTTLRASYTGHYRKGLIDLLGVLEFRSTNTARQPVIEALALISRYARAGNLTCYPAGETAPEHRGTSGDWADLVSGRTSMAVAGWSAWCTRSPRSRRCASSFAARRSGSSARAGGATRTRTCPGTSRPAAPSTTRASASRWTRPSSSAGCGRRWRRHWARWTTRCPTWTGSTSPSGAPGRSASRRSRPRRGGSRARSPAGGRRSR